MPKRTEGSARWALVALAVVAISALGLAGWLLLRPTSPGETSTAAEYSSAQQADAKAKTCATFMTVSKGVRMNNNLAPPGGDGDVTGLMAVTTNARLSLFFGGQYLLARLDPATPSDIASEIRTFSNNLMDIVAAATAGTPNTDPVQTALLKDTEALNSKIEGMCK